MIFIGLNSDKDVAKLEYMSAIISTLKKSPMFQLSLSSKELFHSNFMGWLADFYRKPFANMLKELIGDVEWLKEFAENKFLDGSPNVPKYVVLREKNHYDFSIWEQKEKRGGGYTISHPVLILENKLKSVPDAKQLAEYEERSNGAKLILLYMIEPCFKNDKWKSLSYEKYVGLIKKHILPEIKESVAKGLVVDYCDNFILNICKLVDMWNGNECMFNESEERIARDLRIDDLREKMRFSKMANLLRNKLQDDMFKITVGFTNGNGLLDCTIKIDEEYKIGVQIQGKQYRRFLVCNNNSSINIKVLQELANKYYPCFFIDRPGGKSDAYGNITEIKKKAYQKRSDEGEGEKMFCKYNDTFIYQYRNIKSDVKMSQVLDQIVKDMLHLKKNLKNIK